MNFALSEDIGTINSRLTIVGLTEQRRWHPLYAENGGKFIIAKLLSFLGSN
jgi:hypothetical protein